MRKLAFVMSGPQGGQVIEMDEADFDKALEQGWIVDFEKANKGGDRDPFRGYNTDPHEHADAYLVSKGLYPNREMKAADPKDSKPDTKSDTEADKSDTAKPKPAAKTVRK